MKMTLIRIFILIAILTGCGPNYVRIEQMPSLNRITILLNVTMAVDIPDQPDGLDVDKSKEIAQYILDKLSRDLTRKGQTIVEQIVTVGSRYEIQARYIPVSDPSEMHKAGNKAPLRFEPRPKRLKARDISVIFNSLESKFPIYKLNALELNGDLLLIMSVRGRIVGLGKQLAGAAGEVLKGVAIIGTGIILGRAAEGLRGFSGGPGNSGDEPPKNDKRRINDSDDTFYVEIAYYQKSSGRHLWSQHDINTDYFEDIPNALVEHMEHISVAVDDNNELMFEN